MSDAAISDPLDSVYSSVLPVLPDAAVDALDDPPAPPFSAAGGLSQDRLNGETVDLMRGWLGDIQPLSRRSLRKNAHVTRLTG
jgi:hypothetical protein